jgi:hypothetical protein
VNFFKFLCFAINYALKTIRRKITFSDESREVQVQHHTMVSILDMAVKNRRMFMGRKDWCAFSKDTGYSRRDAFWGGVTV